MPPTLAELIDALPVEAEQEPSAEQQLQELAQTLAHKPVPTDRFIRLWTLGTLSAKIAAAYTAWWIRSLYAGADERQRRLNETYLRSALRALGTMGYLRGAVMKLGQMLGHWPHVVPDEFAALLGRLHFEAPPMHFALLREHLRNELGREPQDVFEDFETRAFAAASLGQVHRAVLRGSGRPVAVKIQYPNIARTIRSDLANLQAIVSPMRLSGDWDSIREQFDDVCAMLELEVDYVEEARNLHIARDAVRDLDDVVVPEVHEAHSTKRVLTMDYVEGLHLEAFLARNPSQELRDRHGHQIALAGMRLSYGSELLYADLHPGNFLFLPEGRLGWIDFGCCRRYSREEIEYVTEVELASYTSREAVRRALVRAADMTPQHQQEEERFDLMLRWCDWVWEPIEHHGPFDFGDPDYFQRGLELFGEMIRRRYVRSLPVNTWLTKSFFGLRAILHHLGARVDLGAIVRQETTVQRPD